VGAVYGSSHRRPWNIKHKVLPRPRATAEPNFLYVSLINMRQSQFLEQERRLAEEKRIKYKGTARIRLDVLHFQWNKPRELNQKNLERLKSCFQTEGCRRLELENHVPAIIDQLQLDDAMQASNISASAMMTNQTNDYPELNFPAGYQLKCLHGRHRVQAGREFLPPRDKWWTVDLYLAGMSTSDERRLPFSDCFCPRY